MSAMVPLANITLGSTATTITFSGIPATFRDLRVVVDFTPSAATGDILAQFNSDNGSNYSYVEAGGNGSSAYSGTSTRTGNLIGYLVGSGKTIIEFSIMDYSASDKHKVSLIRQSTAGETSAMRASRWASNAIVSSIVISPSTSNFAAGSIFTLYGVKA